MYLRMYCLCISCMYSLRILSAVVFLVYSHIFYSIFSSIFKCIHVARRKYSVPWCIVTVSCHGETYGLVWTFQNAFTPQLPMFIKARHAKYEGQQCSGHVCSHPLTGGGPCPASRLAPRDRFWVDVCPYGQSIREYGLVCTFVYCVRKRTHCVKSTQLGRVSIT